MKTQLVLLSFICLLSSACSQNPAQVVNHRGPTYNEYTNHTINKYYNKINPLKLTVQKGDTIYNIAKRHDVSVRSVIDINDFAPPYNLKIGQKIKLPKSTFHIVKPKDTLYFISRGYNVDLDQLKNANNLEYPYNISVGQKLVLPNPSEYNSINISQNTERPRIAPKSAKAKKTDELKTVDNEPVEITSAIEYPDAPEPTLKPQKRVAKAPVKSTAKKKTTNTKTKTASNRKTSFQWPVDGNIISEYGPKQGGLFNDGINISAPEGSLIKASDAGEVVYAGNELRGYGNLILIKHDNGYITAYAHAKDSLVIKGTKVKKGQTIGYVGRTGHVSSPQLHFSIRKGRKALNPKNHLS